MTDAAKSVLLGIEPLSHKELDAVRALVEAGDSLGKPLQRALLATYDEQQKRRQSLAILLHDALNMIDVHVREGAPINMRMWARAEKFMGIKRPPGNEDRDTFFQDRQDETPYVFCCDHDGSKLAEWNASMERLQALDEADRKSREL